MSDYKTIHVDLTATASLDFTKEREVAKASIMQGFFLVFELDFGLFKLKKSLSNESQLLSLKLGLAHFKTTLYDEFQEKIVDLIIYKGPLNFADQLKFEENEQGEGNAFHQWLTDRHLRIESFYQDSFLRALFSRDYCFSYLYLLTENQNFSIPFSLKLEEREIADDPLLFALLTHSEVSTPFKLVFENFAPETKAPIAFCLPSKNIVDQKKYAFFVKIWRLLEEKKIPYRLIAESHLISEWELVDYLFILEETVGKEGRRKLAGFTAAGGVVVSESKQILLENEMTLDEFSKIIGNLQLT